jgi:hypothetical protein
MIRLVAVEIRYDSEGRIMFRIPPWDENRGMMEGLCLSCQARTAEWRNEHWQSCHGCAHMTVDKR